MISRRWIRFAALALFVPFLVALRCSEEGEPLAIESFSAVIDLVNTSDQAVHILVEAEGFGAHNRIGPGGIRNTQMTLERDEIYTFAVGEGGRVFTEVACLVTGTRDDGYFVRYSVIRTPASTQHFLKCAGSGWGT